MSGGSLKMKITAKIAYKDDTHKQMMFWYDLWTNTYEQLIEEDNSEMVDHMYNYLMAVIDVLYFTHCINYEHKKYMEHEVNKMRGWA